MIFAGGWSFSVAYILPIGLRTWFVERLVKQLEAEKEAVESNQSGRSKSQVLSVHNQPTPPPHLK